MKPNFLFTCAVQILLCDSCDSGYHTACLRPPLMVIPDGEWFCPPCQHVRINLTSPHLIWEKLKVKEKYANV